MAKYTWFAGLTSRTILVKLKDSSSSTGAGLPGIVAANLNVRAIRVLTTNTVTSAAISVSDLASIASAYSSGGWKQIDATNSPGWYRFDVPDSLLASGAWTAGISIIDAGSNNIAAQDIEIQLDPVPISPPSIGLASANLDTQLALIASYVDTEVAAIKAKTDNLPAQPAAVGSAMTLTSVYDFAKGTVPVAESYAANGVAPSPAQALMAIHQMLMYFAITGTNINVKRLNGAAAFTVTLDNAAAPTAASRP